LVSLNKFRAALIVGDISSSVVSLNIILATSLFTRVLTSSSLELESSFVFLARRLDLLGVPSLLIATASFLFEIGALPEPSELISSILVLIRFERGIFALLTGVLTSLAGVLASLVGTALASIAAFTSILAILLDITITIIESLIYAAATSSSYFRRTLSRRC
jgi:hypothetical protein